MFDTRASVQKVDYIEALAWDLEREIAPGSLELITDREADEMIEEMEGKLSRVST